MNKLIFIFTLLVVVCYASSAQTKNSDYPITIKKGKIGKEGKFKFLEIPVTHHNHTKDTLYYYNWLCSWQRFYDSNSNALQVEHVPCDKNFLTILKIPPGRTSTVNLRLLILEPNQKDKISLRIGFNLLIANDPKDLPTIEDSHKKNIIWSNQITISR